MNTVLRLCLLPVIALWAMSVGLFMPYRGRSLADWEEAIARRVGVKNPARIRLVMVSELPFPNLSWIHRLAVQHGMSRSGAIGLTLGYGIFIREGAYSVRLLSHECRHVQQYEAAGSVWRFLDRYISEVLVHGYQNAPLEKEARAYEIANVLKGGRIALPEESSNEKSVEPQECEDA